MKPKRGILSLVTVIAVILPLFLLSGFLTESVIETYMQNSAFPQRTCVIIDAGHGGVDGGAVSCSGIPESKFNLDIALRLNDIMHLLGIDTRMIRSEDVSIYTSGQTIAATKISDLRNRVNIINETQNAILISIHQNYFHQSQYKGAQVFYRNADPALARQLQNSIVQTVNPGSKRKAKPANGIYLMDNIHCPAALIECGFISNPEEELLLKNDIYQRKLCCTIATTVSCYIYNNGLA